MPIVKDILDRTLGSPYGEHAYHLVELLTDAGYEAWWVGGGVRDMLMGNVPVDIDLATSARPTDLLALFRRSFDASQELGGVRVPMGGHVFEVTTFREEDALSDGRHPESVTFGSREQDAKRRDFTVNAIYFHPISSELYDPFGGQGDIREKLIRFIGDPALRIRHDALRMLRAVRFRAALDGQYHPDTFTALRELAAMVEVLSGSRQLEELEKMLAGPRPERALEDLWELHILHYFLPELAACKGIPQPADYHREGDVWDHTLQCVGSFREEDDADVRLAALFHDSGKTRTFSLKERIRFDHHASVSAETARICLRRLQCPARRQERIAWLIEHHMMMGSFMDMGDERKAHWYYHPWFEDLLRLFFLDIAGTRPADFSLYDRIVADRTHFLDAHPRAPKVLLTGDVVMSLLHLQPGEEVGRILSILHDAQITGEITTKREAEELVKRLRTQ